MSKKSVLEVFNAYNDALVKGDFPAVFEQMVDDVKWHQPGKNSLSGLVVGKQALGAHLGQFAERSNGTFKVVTNWVSSNDDLVAANVTFLADRDGIKLDMNGIDLFRIKDGKIQEVWLFSSEQDVEDSFGNK
ncbi:conserved hypothetical protein (DUF1486) [Paracholeplasma brassicae]|uniref:SnoaL-like domain-containing protein n=1 Tax=Acholeplasma brassicae TaxID=61635 RepID=U4KPD7_9MOLU|nr:nuclear transport factor 2 family protein [Paracholeplasma brassicae]CCV66312.1 conserved hypothetical protein (DUF1486) [Paracholeplasma brassicae]